MSWLHQLSSSSAIMFTCLHAYVLANMHSQLQPEVQETMHDIRLQMTHLWFVLRVDIGGVCKVVLGDSLCSRSGAGVAIGTFHLWRWGKVHLESELLHSDCISVISSIGLKTFYQGVAKC